MEPENLEIYEPNSFSKQAHQYAEEDFFQRRKFHPSEAEWRDQQFGAELRCAKAAFMAGTAAAVAVTSATTKMILELVGEGTSVKFEPTLCPQRSFVVKMKRAHEYPNRQLIIWRHLKQHVSPKVLAASAIRPDGMLAQILELMHRVVLSDTKQPCVWESPDP